MTVQSRTDFVDVYSAERQQENEGVQRIVSMLTVEKPVAAQLYRGVSTGWKEFADLHDGIARQLHQIKKLKVCYDRKLGRFVGYYSRGVLTSGSFRRVKSVCRIDGPKIEISRYVRYTTLAKNPLWVQQHPRRTLEEERKSFLDDMARDIRARRDLSGVPNIAQLKLTKYRPYGKDLEASRFIMEQYNGNMHSASKYTALKGITRVLAALKGMHAKGWVHGDVKAGNVLMRGAQSFLSDFGLARKIGEPVINLWTSYMAPEIALAGCKADPKADVFSLGILLLNILDREKLSSLRAVSLEEDGMEKYKMKLDELLKKLQTSDLYRLISRLLQAVFCNLIRKTAQR
jgi:serine/threonine protein kinase